MLSGQIAGVPRPLWAHARRRRRGFLEHASRQSVEACMVEVGVYWSAKMRGRPTICLASDMAPDAHKDRMRHELPAAARVTRATVRSQSSLPRLVEPAQQVDRSPSGRERVAIGR
jgi:hypothetical protein